METRSSIGAIYRYRIIMAKQQLDINDVVTALRVAAEALSIAADHNVDNVQCEPPQEWGLDAFGEDTKDGWCGTRPLANKLRQLSEELLVNNNIKCADSTHVLTATTDEAEAMAVLMQRLLKLFEDRVQVYTDEIQLGEKGMFTRIFDKVNMLRMLVWDEKPAASLPENSLDVYLGLAIDVLVSHLVKTGQWPKNGTRK